MKYYKGFPVAKGSALYEALDIKDDKERSKAAKKIFDETTDRYKKLYPQSDIEWFAAWTNKAEYNETA